MWCKLTEEKITELVNNQINNHWGEAEPPKIELDMVKVALDRLEACFIEVKSNYFWKDGEVTFRIEHSVQYSIFLYYLSNTLYKNGQEESASYVYYLNKIMHSVDWFYAISLPVHFCAEHPLGSVLGRAEYGDNFFVYQGTTIGGNRKNGVLSYPKIGNNVVVYANATVLGGAKIGDNVIISANTYIKDEEIPSNCIVFG